MKIIMSVSSNSSSSSSETSFTHSSLFNDLINMSSNSAEKKEEIADITPFLRRIDVLLGKKNYADIIKLIESQEKGIQFSQYNYFTLFDIKMKTYYKITEKKLSVKSENFYLIYGKRRLYYEKLFKKIETNLETSIRIIKTQKLPLQYREKMIQIFTEGSFYQAKFCFLRNRPQDAVCYLSIANNILFNFYKDSQESYTLAIYQNILLLLSTILILDNSFQHAYQLLEHCISICFLELRLLLNSNENYNDQQKIDVLEVERNIDTRFGKKIIKNLQNFVITSFQMGACEESSSDIIKAIEKYKAARWFCLKFLLAYNPKLGAISKSLETRALDYMSYFLEEKAKKERYKLMQEKEQEELLKSQEKNKRLAKISHGLTGDVNKFYPLQKFIEKKLPKKPEVCTINSKFREKTKIKQKEYLLSNVNLYKDLLSSDYRNYIEGSSNMFFNTLDKDSAVKLDHYNNKLLSRENRSTGNLKGKMGKRINTFKTGCQTSLSNHLLSSPDSRQKLSTFSKFPKNQSLNSLLKNEEQSKRSYNISNTSSPKVMSKQSTLNKSRNELRKKYSLTNKSNEQIGTKYPYMYSKTFKKKTEYLEKMYNKELKFQKELLHLKRMETIYQKNYTTDDMKYDDIKIKEKAEDEYNFLKSKVYMKESKKKQVVETDHNEQIQRLKTLKKRYRNSLISGLNTKNFDDINTIEKKETFIKKEKYKRRYLYLSVNKEDNTFNKELKNVKSKNENMIDLLTRDLALVEEEEKHLKRKMRK